MQRETLGHYQKQIQEWTGSTPEEAAILEEIMRHEVFHSTLDWQTESEFRVGARKALKLYLADREFYDADARARRASFRLFSAEQALKQARQENASGTELAEAELALERARFDEAAARAALSEIAEY